MTETNSSYTINPITNKVKILFLSFLYFCFIYSFRLPGLPAEVESYQAVVVALFVYVFFSTGIAIFRFGKFRTSHLVKRYLSWNVFLIVYISLLIETIGEGDGYVPLPQFYIMIIVLSLFFLSGKYVFKNLDELMAVIYIIGIVQAFMVLLSTILPPFEALMKAVLISGVYGETGLLDDMVKNSGYHIGFSCFTSKGCLKIAISQIASCYFLISCKEKKLIKHIAFFFLLTIATSLVARTGLFVSLACLFVVLLAKRRQGSKGTLKYIFIFFVIIILLSIVSSVFVSTDTLSKMFVRFAVLFDNGIKGTYFDGFLGNVGENVIPEISSETMVGLGVIGGVSGSGIRAVADGGFATNYISMGLIVCVINYIIIFGFFMRSYKKTKMWQFRYLIMFMFAVFLIGEIKERYTYLYYYMCFMFLILYLIEKEERFNNVSIVRNKLFSK